MDVNVAEIQETVGVEDFHYITSNCNLADTLSRGTNPQQLENWLEGPSFLQMHKTNWPKFQKEIESVHEEDPGNLNGNESYRQDENVCEAQNSLSKSSHQLRASQV